MTINIGANIRIHKLSLCVSAILLILLYLYAIRESSLLTWRSNTDTISLKSLLAASIKAAEIGGLEVINVHENIKMIIENKGKTKEGIDDPVTTADYRSHCAMYNYLLNNFPSSLIISEEKSKGCDDTNKQDLKIDATILQHIQNIDDIEVNVEDITIWIDPLDATKEFTENLLNYVTTMVCIAVKGMPSIGVIHKPFESKQTYWAWTNHGSSSNLHTLSATEINKDPVLIVSRSHAGRVYNSSKIALGDDVRIISAAGAGYKSLEVANRNVTAYIHMTMIKKWDICSGAAIITALGGMVTSLDGEPLMDFDSKSSVNLNHGILATMMDHRWYLNKFSNL
ncbi:hypothetical protein PV327_001819 [Microctonus hyperodae]|uniref:inositol-phosphate phosphatase n=1 Tax=Microctonus hyperodae TaxID=165561 RepID=A0AA39FEB4_MICHY|nr:hypothetical protein PV327_001819 [Microctonus hyperodae]